jgi:hypothetical protein
MQKQDDVARVLWKAKGKLYPCPNPPHDFQVGRLMGQWTWAEDCWSEVSSNGHLHNIYFRCCSIETLSGLKSYSLTVWKLNIIIGILDK